MGRAASARMTKKERTSKALQKAALELAIENENDKATVEEICERAGVSRMTFFNHFPSKDMVYIGQSEKLPTKDEIVDALESNQDAAYLDTLVTIIRSMHAIRADEEIHELRQRALALVPTLGLKERRHEGDVRETLWMALASYLEIQPSQRLAPDMPLEDEIATAVDMAMALARIGFAHFVRTATMPKPLDLRHDVAAYLATDTPPLP